VPCSPDWLPDEAYLDDEYPGDLEEYEDPDNAPPPGLDDDQLTALIAEAREITAAEARAAEIAARLGHTAALAAAASALAGRRGPGMPGSAESFPGEYTSPAAGFATAKPLDTAPGGVVLASFLDDAAGEDDRYAGATDDELVGVICAWDRDEAYASARKHAAVAELIRRRAAAGCALEGPAQMPAGWDEFAAVELAAALGESRDAAGQMLSLASALEISLPGTKAAFRAGILSRAKAAIIAWATVLLDPDEARAAEAMVLDRAGQLTPGGLRAAIMRAVMDVNPEKANKRREHEATQTRVERWAEPSGNASLAGRELPPAEVLAADQRVTAWAKELRKAGLDGTMDQLRARAYLDILLGTDSRPLGTSPDGTDSRHPGTSPDGTDGQDHDGAGPDNGGSSSSDPSGRPAPAPAGPLAGVIPPGFAGRVNLTIPATTLLDRAGRPGEMGGIGPIDPKPEANTSDCYRSQVLLNRLSEVGATAARHPPE
jgi:Domain of unknown function (DUF222)